VKCRRTAQALSIRANESLLLTAVREFDEQCLQICAGQSGAGAGAICRADGRHLVEVCDNGPGIPPEEQKLIFEPFFRSPRHLSIKGTGVGLARGPKPSDGTSAKLYFRSKVPGLRGGAVFRMGLPCSNYLGEVDDA